jgi:hypothetical protein
MSVIFYLTGSLKPPGANPGGAVVGNTHMSVRGPKKSVGLREREGSSYEDNAAAVWPCCAVV